MIDTFGSYVWEPALVKANAITAATEAACLVLSVDETVLRPPAAEACGQMLYDIAPRGHCSRHLRIRANSESAGTECLGWQPSG